MHGGSVPAALPSRVVRGYRSRDAERLVESRTQAQPGQKRTGNRRNFAFVGVLALCGLTFWFAAPWIERTLLVGDFDFADLEQPAGFRHIRTGDVSGAVDPFAGVDGGGYPNATQAVDLDGRELCLALFGAEPTAGVVPIAYFSDYRCPFCRVLSEHLAELEDDRPEDVRIAWHEWPVFGGPSELAARAALAAKRQDAYAAFHARLMRSSFVPTPAYLRSLSEEAGIDADRLVEDMQSPEVDREMGEARALAGVFSFPGTPGLVIGRTVVVGAIGEAELRALVDREIADGPIEACR
jgi:protein-disulfide isomerase